MIRKLLFCTLTVSQLASAQTNDSVALGAAYANESYYSFSTGETANVNNTNWHLAFDLSAWGSTIRLNRKAVSLYVAPGDASIYSILDTNGMNGWEQHINGYNAWSEGALNKAADATNPFDLGWGAYNSVTHVINGSRVFVLAFASGEYKKLVIESLASGTYSFKYADIDGSNEEIQTITKSNYSNRNFVYFNLLDATILDREAPKSDWDIVFTNYVLELAPGYFGGVTSVLQNNNVYVAKSAGVPVPNATYSQWDSTISVVGYDWKTFNSGTFQYDIVDSLCYFVQTASGDIWKLIFTGFAGSSTGKIYFTKQQVAFAHLTENKLENFSMYPNPTHGNIHIDFTGSYSSLTMVDSKGKMVYAQDTQGIKNLTINTNEFKNGVYFIRLHTPEGVSSLEKVIVAH